MYIGVTSDLPRRLKEHSRKSGSPEAARRRVGELVYKEVFSDKKEAIRRERQVKHWSRAKKEALIRGDTISLHSLAKSRKSTPSKRIS